MKFGLRGISVFEASGDSGVLVGKNAPAEMQISSVSTTFLAARTSRPLVPRQCLRAAILPIHGAPRTNSDPVAASVTYTELPRGMSLIWSSEFSFTSSFSFRTPAGELSLTWAISYIAKYDPGYPSYNTTNNIPDNGGKYNRIGLAVPDISAIG